MKTRRTVSAFLGFGLFFPSTTSPKTTATTTSRRTCRYFTSRIFPHLYFFDIILSKYNGRLVERIPGGLKRHTLENYSSCSCCSCCQSSFCISKKFFSTSCSSLLLSSSTFSGSSMPKMGGVSHVQGERCSGRSPGRLVRSHSYHHCHHPSLPMEGKQVGEENAHLVVVSKLALLFKQKEVVFAERMKHLQFAYTRSYRYAEWCLWGLWGSLLCMLSLLFLGTYHIFSWNVIEPITYLLGYTQILCGLWWYQRHGVEFSSSIFRKQIAESYYQRKFMRKGKRGPGWCGRRLLTPPSPLFRHRFSCLNTCTRTMKEEVDFLSKMFHDIQQLRSLIRHEKKKMDLLSAQPPWTKKPALKDTHSK